MHNSRLVHLDGSWEYSAFDQGTAHFVDWIAISAPVVQSAPRCVFVSLEVRRVSHVDHRVGQAVKLASRKNSSAGFVLNKLGSRTNHIAGHDGQTGGHGLLN